MKTFFKNTGLKVYTIINISVVLLMGCIEEIEPEPIAFESVIIVEATILDKLQQQTIFLNRSFNFGEAGPRPVVGANVVVRDDAGNSYDFVQEDPGVYRSEIEFAAVAGRTYALEVLTTNGSMYISSAESLPAPSEIDRVYAERIKNQDGSDGIAIKVDSYDPQGEARNYRYIYEETFKIIAPRWSSQKLVENLETENECDLMLVDEGEEERICYRTEISNSIILFDTNNLTEDRVDGFITRFIDSDNYILSHRYSILVKQIVQSDVAYNYYQTLEDFSGNESLFSQTQPGFLVGNIEGIGTDIERVLGFFEVASIDEERIFFDFEDFYQGEPLPPYIIECNEFAPPLASMAGCVLLPAVLSNDVKYVGENLEPEIGEGPYFVVRRACGDCTALGSNIVPEFWEE